MKMLETKLFFRMAFGLPFSRTEMSVCMARHEIHIQTLYFLSVRIPFYWGFVQFLNVYCTEESFDAESNIAQDVTKPTNAC